MRVRYKPVCCGDELKKPYSFKDFFHRHLTTFILLLSVITLTSLYLGGILTYLFEEDFTNYSYPLDIVDTRDLVEKIDRFHHLKHHQNLLFGINNVDYDSIVEALGSIKADDRRYAQVVPLTQFRDFSFSIDIKPTCRQQWGVDQVKSTLLSLPSQQHSITVMIVVKSAVNNYARRQAIRNSWYQNGTRESFLFKTVFMVGRCHEKNIVPSSTSQLNTNHSWSADDCNENIKREADTFGDIVQSSGIDSYYNNTIKTYMTLRWLNTRCPADFGLGIDDDYVFEVDNFIYFMHHLVSSYIPNKPISFDSTTPLSSNESEASTGILDSDNSSSNSQTQSSASLKDRRHLANAQKLESKLKEAGAPRTNHSGYRPLHYSEWLEENLVALRRLSRQYVWAGYVRNYVHPLRSVLSKWYISRDDYAFDKYPPFITGGLVLMSFKTIKHLYYATYFTRSFKFDDVYLGILAHKLGLNADHRENFMCPVDDYLDSDPIRPNTTDCIGVHDIEPDQLEDLWARRLSNEHLLAEQRRKHGTLRD